jgi:hypothetical protein
MSITPTTAPATSAGGRQMLGYTHQQTTRLAAEASSPWNRYGAATTTIPGTSHQRSWWQVSAYPGRTRRGPPSNVVPARHVPALGARSRPGRNDGEPGGVVATQVIDGTAGPHTDQAESSRFAGWSRSADAPARDDDEQRSNSPTCDAIPTSSARYFG